MGLGGSLFKARKKSGLSQGAVAGKLGVSRQTISKWETAKGLPDISLLAPLSAALGVSVMELMSGDAVTNRNRSANMRRSRLYVCPVCGNVIHAMGEAVVSCCGITLPALEAEEPDIAHEPRIEAVEDEVYITVEHPMTKTHFISFIAYVTADRFQMVKLYPEGDAACRLRLQGHGDLYLCCNRHGLMKRRV